MENENTRQKILRCALELFSQYGYEAVSVEQIARAVGVRAPSLYKHYKSKQDIFDAIFQEMARRYDQQTARMQMHLQNAGADVGMFGPMDADTLAQKVCQLVEYSLHDEYVSRFRRLLTIEQFHDADFAALYSKRYFEDMLCYHEALLGQLMRGGVLQNGPVQVMALQFISPIYVLLGLCDRQPEREDWALQQLKAHVRQFHAMYARKEEEK